MEFRIDSLDDPLVIELLSDHVLEMRITLPPESTHVLDLDALRRPAVTVWTFWDDQMLVGCGALKQLTSFHVEIKSMRTAPEFRGRGFGKTILQHLLDQSRLRGYHQVSLETGSMDFFVPARRLYARFGFVECEPFGAYVADPNSVFMTRRVVS